MHCFHVTQDLRLMDHDALLTSIFARMARRNNKSIERIKRLLLIQQDDKLNRQLWKIIDKELPGHSYEYVGCCAHCGSFELRETPP